MTIKFEVKQGIPVAEGGPYSGALRVDVVPYRRSGVRADTRSMVYISNFVAEGCSGLGRGLRVS